MGTRSALHGNKFEKWYFQNINKSDIMGLCTVGTAKGVIVLTGQLSKIDTGKTPVREVVQNYSLEAKRIFGSQLKAVILYGSYARGDFDRDSDIDIMVLLDIPREQLPEARKKMRATANELDMEYDCVISSVFQSYDVFECYKCASPFYQNIEREGVLVG